MKYKPIHFSLLMVRALLDGSNMQTRHVVKGEALDWLDGALFSPSFVADPENQLCPYCQSGDLLWVRKTWGTGNRRCPFNGWMDGAYPGTSHIFLIRKKLHPSPQRDNQPWCNSTGIPSRSV